MKSIIIVSLLLSGSILSADFIRTRDYKTDITIDGNSNGVGSSMNFDIWQTKNGSIYIGSGLKVTTYTNKVVDEVQYKYLDGRKPTKYGIGWNVSNLTVNTKSGLYLRVSPINFMISDIDEGFNPSAQIGYRFGSKDFSMSIFVGSDISEYRKGYAGIGFWF